MTNTPASPTEAPHFTREWLLSALRCVRGDFEAARSGEADGDRALARLEAARLLGLDALAADALAAIDRAIEEIPRLEWPGGLETRYAALIGALRALAEASAAFNPHAPDRPHLAYLADAMARAELAAASAARRRAAERLRGLYVIVDPALTGGRGPLQVAEQAVAGGASAVQLRVKDDGKGRWLPLARELRALCADAGAAFIVNDHPDVAAAADADGVHLGQGDLPLSAARKALRPWQIAGTSNALLDEALASAAQGADYVAVGRMFPTNSKTDTRPAGPETLRAVRSALPEGGPPLLAIGGVTPENAPEVARAGADGICVIAAVTLADDPRAAAKRLADAFASAKRA